MTYVLLHGAWHDSSVWQRVKNLLEAQDHTVFTPDLPGRKSRKDINLQTHVDFVVNLIQQQSEPVILVGHSMSGIIISQVAEIIPNKIKRLFYVAAFIAKDGQSLFDVAENFSLTKVSQTMQLDFDVNVIKLNKTALQDYFYNCCDKVTKAQAIKIQIDEPLQPLTDKLHLTDTNFGEVDKTYIATKQDKIRPIEEQKLMCQDVVDDIIELDCDHSPFYSCPDELTEILLRR